MNSSGERFLRVMISSSSIVNSKFSLCLYAVVVVIWNREAHLRHQAGGEVQLSNA